MATSSIREKKWNLTRKADVCGYQRVLTRVASSKSRTSRVRGASRFHCKPPTPADDNLTPCQPTARSRTSTEARVGNNQAEELNKKVIFAGGGWGCRKSIECQVTDRPPHELQTMMKPEDNLQLFTHAHEQVAVTPGSRDLWRQSIIVVITFITFVQRIPRVGVRVMRCTQKPSNRASKQLKCRQTDDTSDDRVMKADNC